MLRKTCVSSQKNGVLTLLLKFLWPPMVLLLEPPYFFTHAVCAFFKTHLDREKMDSCNTLTCRLFLSISVMTSDLAQGKKAQLEAPSQLARPHYERRHTQTKKEPFRPLPTRTFPTRKRQCNLEPVHLVFGFQMSLSRRNGKK